MDNLDFIRLTSDTEITSFDCGDADLNNFLIEDAKSHLEGLVAVTYLILQEQKIVAYFNYLNDKISHHDLKGNSSVFLARVSSFFSDGKNNYKSYPAVKIGRLAVCVDMKRSGLGTKILDYTKNLFVSNNRTGCSFITVDSINNDEATKFYLKNGFKFLTSADKKSDTRLMYFNLNTI